MDWHEAKAEARRTVVGHIFRQDTIVAWTKLTSVDTRIGLFLQYTLKMEFGKIFQWIICGVGKKRAIKMWLQVFGNEQMGE